MHFTNLKIKAICFAILITFISGQAAFGKDISAIVIHDTSEVYSSGQVIAPEDILQLEQGDKLLVVLPNGKTKTLEGPYSGVGRDFEKTSSMVRDWRKLLLDLTQREGPSNVIGGVRELIALPTLYLNDIPKHSFCVSPSLVVSSTFNEQDVKIKSSQSGISVTLPTGTNILWPQFFDNSEKYVILTGDRVNFLNVKIIESYSLSTLNKAKCTKQYERLLASIVSDAID